MKKTTQNISPLINTTELLALFSNENLVIVDATNGPSARDQYLKNHIKGAVHVDLNTQLSSIKEDVANGGRHPLPTIERFTETLSELGITKASHVVVYDNNNGTIAATRLWWMLRAIGHEKVQVLNGGVLEATNGGIQIETGTSQPRKTEKYKMGQWQLPIAAMDEIEKNANKKDALIIDVRESPRFNGEFEPIDLIAGHIPGAINIPFSENLDEAGLFKSASQLKAEHEKILSNYSAENTYIHCGSGVTACHTILALEYAGFKIPKLYVGSWSEWSRNEKPMITKI